MYKAYGTLTDGNDNNGGSERSEAILSQSVTLLLAKKVRLKIYIGGRNLSNLIDIFSVSLLSPRPLPFVQGCWNTYTINVLNGIHICLWTRKMRENISSWKVRLDISRSKRNDLTFYRSLFASEATN